MTLTEQVKILDDKIKVNKAQYNLDRKAAKISALSSGEQQLEAVKEQGEKQLQILAKKTNQVNNFKNKYFRDSEAKKLMMKLRNKVKGLIIQNLSALAQLIINIILPSF